MKDLLSQLDSESRLMTAQCGQLAAELGFRAYVVGGPVRDLLLNCFNLDLDIVVEGDAMRIAQNFALRNKASKLVRYPAFRTATVTLKGGRFVDFATAREETYARPGAFPKVIPSDIKHDLFRRDFTINAMAIAINPASLGKLVDPFLGYKDLRTKRIRVLHENSFIDDPTRIIRAARFMARFGFSLERKTHQLLKDAIKTEALDTIKPQRYLKELKKIRNESTQKSAIDLLKSWGVYRREK